ncbi:4a-hydroxytetrahydrobiopterin dehydratase [Phycicoccus badiiscoriae]|uniref:Putative pterin-4-alpha-carbinolamine dehydratase n=1 Tax=Pedococcus badiiscoriae TaxID=642776 RepID=A0A852WB04_9MICO|nr:4a-hydroxytetrahydrobiopterin dehydratase [Pedococcus badiiscoriae]NYG06273.1 4a-hydroxytetrahydrobiopterin dehydratase [Pedococcus badiiscoriae]
MSRLLTDEEIGRQLGELPGWTRQGGEISASYQAPDFPTAVRLVDEVALEAEDMDHHPDIDIRWRTVKFVLSTHSEGGLTQLDVELAHRVTQAAARLKATADG